LRQLGLAIEDEASTIIDRLLVDARERVLVVHNEEDWALRGARTVTAAWPFSIESQSFADIKTIPEAIGAAMRVTASQTRRQELSDLLGEQLEFLPRARSDLDGVVAFVSHIEAAALVPALRFHFGDHLPVYASSQSARTTDGLSALDGFHISAMPFNLDEDALASSLKQNFDVAGSNVGALYALGIDAYRVSDRWQHFAIENDQIYGSTGRLQLDADGRIRRTLMWGLVSGGQLTPAL
jgi:outer membrane PBP1 activator LpoA protein